MLYKLRAAATNSCTFLRAMNKEEVTDGIRKLGEFFAKRKGKKPRVPAKRKSEFVDDEAEASSPDSETETAEGEEGEDDSFIVPDSQPEDAGFDSQQYAQDPDAPSCPSSPVIGKTPTKEPKTPSEFRLRSKWVLLTYPRCTEDPADVLQQIIDREKLLDKAFAVRELHSGSVPKEIQSKLKGAEAKELVGDLEGEGHHIHILLGFNLAGRRGVDIKSARRFDFNGFHCNIKRVRSGTEGNVLDYIMKTWLLLTKEEQEVMEDLGCTYVSYRMDWPEVRMQLKRREMNAQTDETLDEFIDAVDNGIDLKIWAETPSKTKKKWIFKNTTKVKQYITMLHKEKEITYKDWQLPQYTGANTKTHSLLKWLWRAFFDDEERQLREKNLWLRSEPGRGKSTFKTLLMERVKCYVVPYEDFDTSFTDEEDCIVCDEFTGRRSIDYIKSISDGSPYALKRKNLAPILKMKRMPVIVLSMYEPFMIPNWCGSMTSIELKAVCDRFEVIDFGYEMIPNDLIFSIVF